MQISAQTSAPTGSMLDLKTIYQTADMEEGEMVEGKTEGVAEPKTQDTSACRYPDTGSTAPGNGSGDGTGHHHQAFPRGPGLGSPLSRQGVSRKQVHEAGQRDRRGTLGR